MKREIPVWARAEREPARVTVTQALGSVWLCLEHNHVIALRHTRDACTRRSSEALWLSLNASGTTLFLLSSH